MTKRTKENIQYTLSTFAVENLRPSQRALRLYEKMETGKLSLKDVLAEIEKQHGVRGSNLF